MLSRRTMLKTSASGFGYLAFAALAARGRGQGGRQGRRPARPEGAALPGPRPSASSSSAWRAARATSTPSTTSRSSRPTTASPTAGGRLLRGQAARLAVEVQAARQERPVDLRPLPRTGQARRRTVRRQRHAHRPAGPPAGVPADALRHLPVPPARASGPGCCTAWAPRTRTCRGSSRISPPANNGGPANYGSCFLPAIYQGTKIGERRRRLRRPRRRRHHAGEQPQEPRPVGRRPARATRLRPVAQPRRCSTATAKPRRRRGDRVATNSPSACRPRCRR